MKPTEIIDAVTQLYIKPSLQSQGFRKKASTFWRDAGKVIDVVNVQKSQSNDSASAKFTINLGLYWKPVEELLWRAVVTLPPREYDCTVRVRLGSLFPEGHDFWWEVTPETTADSLGTDAVEKLLSYGLPWLERGHDIEQTMAYVERMRLARQRDAIVTLRQRGEL